MIKISTPHITDEDIIAVKDALYDTQLSGRSPICGELEQAFAKYIGVKHAIAVNSGTSALFLTMKAMGIGPGDEVIVPDFAFIAVPNAVVHTGATPVLVDCEPDTYNIDPKKIVITPKTKAIIAVHTYGHPCDLGKLREFGVPVIEDACEAIGAEYLGKKVGSLGVAGCFSFFANKTITAGEGGMVVTNDDDLAREVRLLKDQYRTGQYLHEKVGYGMSLGAMQCALILSQLNRIDDILAHAKHMAQRYSILGMKPTVKSYAKHSWWMYAIKGSYRFEFLEHRGGFPPVHTQTPYKHLPGSFPVSESLCLTLLPLTCNEQEQDMVINAILRNR